MKMLTYESEVAKPLKNLRFYIAVAASVCMFLLGAASAEEAKTKSKKSPDDAADSALTLAAILESTPSSKEYQDKKHCISKNAIRDSEILSKRHIVLTMRGKKREKMLIQFGRHCFGLHRNAVINLESRGSSRFCVGDYVRSEVFEFGRRSWGPRCTVPSFEPITDYQVDMLRDGLQTGRIE